MSRICGQLVSATPIWVCDSHRLLEQEIQAYLARKSQGAGGDMSILDTGALRAMTKISKGAPRRTDIVLTIVPG